MYKKRIAREHHLTTSQVDLLEKLVMYAREGKLYDPIVPIPAGLHGFRIYVRQEDSLTIASLGDLDALVECGMLSFNFNRMGDGKIYHIEKMAKMTVDPNLILADLSLEEQQRKAWARLRRRFMDVARVLKLSLGQILQIDDLNAAIAELQSVKEQIDLKEPDLAVVREGLHRIGLLLAQGFREWEHSAETADLYQLFGEWSSLAIELVDLDSEQFRLMRKAQQLKD